MFNSPKLSPDFFSHDGVLANFKADRNEIIFFIRSPKIAKTVEKISGAVA